MMEQKDYILREIEKIGWVIRAILQKIFGGRDALSVNPEQQMRETKEMLLNEINFDLDAFLLLDLETTGQYLDKFKGFNVENTEGLAECIAQMGFKDQSGKSKCYLEKALQLFELCNLKSKAYSFEREKNIAKIKNAL
jgi:hypothetical protein